MGVVPTIRFVQEPCGGASMRAAMVALVLVACVGPAFGRDPCRRLIFRPPWCCNCYDYRREADYPWHAPRSAAVAIATVPGKLAVSGAERLLSPRNASTAQRPTPSTWRPTGEPAVDPATEARAAGDNWRARTSVSR